MCLDSLTFSASRNIKSIIRLDITHFIKQVCRSPCFKKSSHFIKDFYVRCVGLLTKCTSIESFCKLCTDVLSVAFSELEDVTDNENRIYKIQNKLLDMMKSDTMIILDEEEYSHIPEINDDDKDKVKQSRKISEFLLKIEEKSKEITNGNRPNPYFCSDFGIRLLKLSKYFTLWTAVMVIHNVNENNPDAKNVPFIPTSAHSEEYFRDLKNQVLKDEKSIRVDKFIIIHLRSLGGTIKLLHASCQPLIQNLSGKSTKDNESVNLEISKDANQVEIDDYLNKVETWKGLKITTKRGKYLTPCADIENMHKRPRMQTKLPLLINGNGLPPIKTHRGI